MKRRVLDLFILITAWGAFLATILVLSSKAIEPGAIMPKTHHTMDELISMEKIQDRFTRLYNEMDGDGDIPETSVNALRQTLSSFTMVRCEEKKQELLGLMDIHMDERREVGHWTGVMTFRNLQSVKGRLAIIVEIESRFVK